MLKPGGRAINSGGGYTEQGMIAPMNPFVDQNGVLTAVGYRFLHSCYLAISRIEERLDKAGIPYESDPMS
jgi:hypothetical protein